jgi:tetratricopeptide (TPR) repeat protein
VKRAVSLKRGLEKIRQLAAAERYRQAFLAADKLLEEWPDNPHLLVTWANLLQLQEADLGPPLEEAKRALQRAVDVDLDAPAPLIELGQFLFALDDNSREASKCFAKAASVSRRLLIESLICQAKALMELGRRSEAMSCLAEAVWLHDRHGTEHNGATRTDVLRQFEELVSPD